MRKLALLGLVLAVGTVAAAASAPSFVIAQEGVPQADIVVPAQSFDAVRYAADELKHHLDRIFGASFEIVREDRFDAAAHPHHFYLGPTKAARKNGLPGEKLKPDERILKTIGKDIFLLGYDNDVRYANIGQTWVAHSIGTVYAVYDFLENELGVKWIWPGESGEVVPHLKTFAVSALDRRDVEPLPERYWYGTEGWGPKLGFTSEEAIAHFYAEQSKFLVRHRVGRRRKTKIGHSFDDWWARFGKTHPEYFNLLPDGTRRPLHQPGLVTMCCSESGVWKQKAADWFAWWQKSGKREWYEPWVNCCENDSAGLCTCANCRAWDPPDPRFGLCPYWKGGFTRDDLDKFWKTQGDWGLSWLVGDNRWDIPKDDANLKPVAPLGDRYANFYNHVQAEVAKLEPRARVIGYAYENYIEAPQKTQVDPRVIIEFVPRSYLPYDQTETEFFRKHWMGWRKAGVRDLTYRPNYMLAGGNFPLDQGPRILEDFAFAYTNGMIGCAFDSLRGSWAVHTLMDYALVRAFRDPLHGYARAREEVLSAFGPARKPVARYLDGIREHTAAWSFADIRRISWSNRIGLQTGGSHDNGSAIVGDFFDDDFFVKGYAALDEALRCAGKDKEIAARVAFLRKGLRDTELTRRTRLAQKAWEANRANAAKKAAFEAAFREMNAYRASVEGDCVCDFRKEAINECHSMGWPHKAVTAKAPAEVAPQKGKSPEAALQSFRAPARAVREVKPGFLWLEAEGFADYGGWVIDTQYVHWMGSAYLITKGVLKPLAPAKTTITVTTPGRWQAYVRTRDWLPEFSPGRFALAVDGRRSATLGASKQAGWAWEKAGAFDLAAGTHTLELIDLAGGFARCDAVVLTTQADYVPPKDGAALAAERLALSGGAKKATDGGTYDVVVVGGGPAGLGASIAAARNGARTLLVHDRPVLGGNASLEQHTSIGGASSYNRSDGAADTREGGIVEESRLLRRAYKISNSAAFQRMVEAEPLLTEHANERVVAAERVDDRVVSVTACNTLTGARITYRGKTFVDGTGDGWIGRFVGADLMYGREAKSDYGEPDAPAVRDDLTMSGCIDDYRYHKVGQEVPFTLPAWAKILPEGFTRPDISGLGARWWLEHPGTFDDLKDPERARDELIRIHLDYWNFLRHHPRFGAQARCCTLDEIKFLNGRREGWRMRGDYVLTSLDCRKGTIFPDAIAYGGWALDVHDPQGVMNPKGNGWWSVDHCKVYTIPYRCLYSKNIANLWMGGRNISVTHAALGSTRIMATIFTTGQAAGTAAALAAAKGVSARAMGQNNAWELRQRLLKDDQFIPGAVNEDPADMARGARVTASSCIDEIVYGKDDPEFIGVTGNWAWRESLWLDVAVSFPRGELTRLDAVVCYLRNREHADREIVADVYASDEIAAPDASRRLLGVARGVLPKGAPQWVPLKLEKSVALTQKYLWVKVRKISSEIDWFSRLHVLPEGGAMAYGKKAGELELHPEHQMAFYTMPARKGRVDARPEYVIDGESRPDLWPSRGTCTHAWRADPKAALPQWVRLDFKRPVRAKEVRLVFDPIMIIDGVPGFEALVKDYDVLGCVGGAWKTLARVKDNVKRLAVHRFDEQELSAVKIQVNATRGREARIQEVRVY